MDKKNLILLVVFGIILIFLAVFTQKIGFPLDSYEYVTVAKTFAGVNNFNMFSGHSMLYPFIISIFLRIWPSLIMIRLVNALWIFLIAWVLLVWLKNKKAFVLFAFSPLAIFLSVQTTPALPASFFLLISYIYYSKNKIKFNELYSGIFLGLSIAVYTPMLLIA